MHTCAHKHVHTTYQKIDWEWIEFIDKLGREDIFTIIENILDYCGWNQENLDLFSLYSVIQKIFVGYPLVTWHVDTFRGLRKIKENWY